MRQRNCTQWFTRLPASAQSVYEVGLPLLQTAAHQDPLGMAVSKHRVQTEHAHREPRDHPAALLLCANM